MMDGSHYSGGLPTGGHHDAHTVYMDTHQTHHQMHTNMHQGMTSQAHAGYPQSVISGPSSTPTSGTTQNRVSNPDELLRQQLLCSGLLLAFGCVLFIGGVIMAALGIAAGTALVVIGILIVCGAIVLGILSKRKRVFLSSPAPPPLQQGPVISGYTPVVGGYIAPPPGPTAPAYNPNFTTPPSAPMQSVYEAPSDPPPSYGSVVGEEKMESKPQYH